MASAFPDEDVDALIPPCKAVIAQFEGSSDVISKPA